MSISETPNREKEQIPPESQSAERGQERGSEPSGSRYAVYEEHELLEMVSAYEDELRWSRMREGIWIALIAHIILFALISWGPRYLLNHGVKIVNPSDVLKDRKDLTYLDLPPDALRKLRSKNPEHISDQDRVAETKQPTLDKKTMEQLQAMRKPGRPAASQEQPTAPQSQPQPQQQTQPPQQQAQQPVRQQASQPLPNNQQSPIDGPRPSAVPAKPSFAMGSQNPSEQMRQDMRSASRNRSGEGLGGDFGRGALAQHPGAAGGAEILSDTMGVDFGPYMQKLIRETYRTWDPLIPEEVNPPISKSGQVDIIFTILPNGRVAEGSMHLAGRSGDSALDRAAWGGIQGSDYPPLPKEFKGPYLQLRFRFQYNMRPQ